LAYRTMDELDQFWPSWKDDSAGTPHSYFIRGSNIHIYPRKSTAAVLTGLRTYYFKSPVTMTDALSPWDEVAYLSPKKFRRFMFVHFAYAARVSSCIELARTEFFARTRFAPRDAYVQVGPQNAEIGMDVHGCILQVAEWMPAQCVAVGGRDG